MQQQRQYGHYIWVIIFRICYQKLALRFHALLIVTIFPFNLKTFWKHWKYIYNVPTIIFRLWYFDVALPLASFQIWPILLWNVHVFTDFQIIMTRKINLLNITNNCHLEFYPRFTSDSATWNIDRQFLWGPALLISPALEKVGILLCQCKYVMFTHISVSLHIYQYLYT